MRLFKLFLLFCGGFVYGSMSWADVEDDWICYSPKKFGVTIKSMSQSGESREYKIPLENFACFEKPLRTDKKNIVDFVVGIPSEQQKNSRFIVNPNDFVLVEQNATNFLREFKAVSFYMEDGSLWGINKLDGRFVSKDGENTQFLYSGINSSLDLLYFYDLAKERFNYQVLRLNVAKKCIWSEWPGIEKVDWAGWSICNEPPPLSSSKLNPSPDTPKDTLNYVNVVSSHFCSKQKKLLSCIDSDEGKCISDLKKVIPSCQVEFLDKNSPASSDGKIFRLSKNHISCLARGLIDLNYKDARQVKSCLNQRVSGGDGGEDLDECRDVSDYLIKKVAPSELCGFVDDCLNQAKAGGSEVYVFCEKKYSEKCNEENGKSWKTVSQIFDDVEVGAKVLKQVNSFFKKKGALHSKTCITL